MNLRTLRRAGFVSLLALAAGCMKTVSTPHDTFAELNLANPAYRELSVAVVYSRNTREGMDFRQGALTGQPGFDPARWFGDHAAGLAPAFKRTMRVETVEDARGTNADLIAVIDDLASFNRGSAKLSIKLSAIFLTPDQKPIDVVSGENDPDKIMWTRGAMGDAARLAQDRFNKALFSSPKLAEFARAGASGRVAPAAAPVPAPVSDVDEPSGPAAAPNPGAHAIVIGIRSYRQKLPAADFADGDAKAVAKRLHHDLGFADENVATLIDEQAARSDFEKYFERWLPNRVREGDEVFVYFSGHGAPNPKTGDAYLVPYDGDPAYLLETAYPVKRLFAALGKLPAKKVTVVMDSCFSGAGGRSVLAKGARPLVAVADDAVPAKITVISASAGDQVSNAYQEKGHGLFTYYFLKGLDARRADLRGVYDLLKPQVSGYARRELNADQTPQWREGK
jgi:hypothetical protein